MVTLVSSWKNFRLLETLLRRVLWFPSTSKEWGEWLMLFLSLLVQRKVTLLTGKNTARYVQNIFKLKKTSFFNFYVLQTWTAMDFPRLQYIPQLFFSVLSSFDILLCFVQGIKFFEPEVTNWLLTFYIWSQHFLESLTWNLNYFLICFVCVIKMFFLVIMNHWLIDGSRSREIHLKRWSTLE